MRSTLIFCLPIDKLRRGGGQGEFNLPRSFELPRKKKNSPVFVSGGAVV